MNWSQLRATRKEALGRFGVVAAGHRLEVETGLRILEQGGNAVDAAVAAAFVAEMAEPAMCSIGGHGVASIYIAKKQEAIVIDFYDVAPASVTPDTYQPLNTRDGLMGLFGYPQVKDNVQSTGYLASMVPSQVAGLAVAHERYGSLPLKDVMAPAIGLAENGVPVDTTTASHIAGAAPIIRRFPTTASYLLKDGLPLRAGSPGYLGDVLVRKDLAQTLRRVALEGSAVFYEGEIAQTIASDMAVNDGIVTLKDLGNYQPFVYQAPRSTYRGYEYVTGGNVTLVETLNILECFGLSGLDPGNPRLLHLMIEAMRLAWADTLMYVGDPRGDDSPWKGLTSKDYSATRAAEIDQGEANPDIQPGNPWEFEGRAPPSTFPWPIGNIGRWDGNTTKMIAMDVQGNVVSLVTSLGAAFGSKVTIPGTGILLNSSMERLDPRPGYLNSVAPGKGMQRLTSAVLVFKDGHPFAALCGSLSIFISGMGLHTMVNLIDFGMGVQEALDGYRFHPTGEAIWIDDRIPQKVVETLAHMGHRLQPFEEAFGQTHFGNQIAIRIDGEAGAIRAGGDALHPNAAAGF